MSNNYSEQIFQSIDKIISQRLNEVSFDKTEICTIISQDSNYTGKYLVSNEAGLKYDAYILDENYQYYEDQKVYVTIPQGDYSFRKVIIGSYYGDEIPKNLYTNPFDNLVINSQYHWINTDNQLSALAYKNNQIDQKSFVSNELTFYYSGLGQFNYIGLDFSATTDFGGTTGEFQIIIDLLDGEKNSLLTSAELGLLTFSSKQLYGNPYYLNHTLKFQHLFNFPVGNFSDLTLVKYAQITLVTKGDFNYNNTDVQSVVLNDLTVYFGFDSSENIMSNSNIVLDLDIPDGTKESSKDYTYSTDVKTMSVEWVNTDTKAIYNETTNMQYPEAKKYNIYWLQYSESVGYKKLLETIKPDILSCYPKDKEITQEEYNNALKAKFKNSFNESIDIYDKVLYDKYSSFYADTYSVFANNIEQAFIDLEESGTYWKTVKKSDAYNSSAYTYSLQPAPTWKNEQIKVIIKSVDGDDYLSSKSLEFINTNFRQETGSNQGKADTLKLTLAEGDDGIYNSYGIDNKLLSTQNETHKITVSFIDESLEKMWNNSVQKVIWKIPKHASMVAVPQVKQENKDGSFEFVDDNRWDKITDPNFYIYTNTATDDAKTVNFNISSQFGHNKTNNSIICEIIRYKSATLDIIDDTYNGSIKLEFGTQGTSGSAYAFNIYPNTSDGLLIDGSNKITFRATLENNQGVTIPFEVANVQWYFLYGDQELKPENLATGNTYELTKDFMVFEGKNSYYFILVAELTGWVDTTGNAINLKAYYPIPHTAKQGYYISGASRVIYTYQGTTPNYDQSPYKLYDQYHNEVPVARWEVRFPDWANEKYYDTDGNKNGYWNNFPALKKLNEENIDVGLQPLSSIQSNVLACNVTAYKDESNAVASILWAQPLLIMRNTYAFDVLNTWDGSLTIDATDNKILSQLIGAGTKNEDNKFTGILMGAVEKYGAASTGLYGFQEGQLRFKADEYGDFYVGTGDDNKINFEDGKLDINAKSFTLKINDGQNANRLYFSNTARSYGTEGKSAWLQFEDKIYFNSDGTATIGNWTVEKSCLASNLKEDYYTGKSGNSSIIGQKYHKADIAISKSGNILLEWDTSSNKYIGKDEVEIGAIRVATKIGNNFGVTAGGILYAKGVNIDGNITAKTLNLDKSIQIGEDNLKLTNTEAAINTNRVNIAANKIIIDSHTTTINSHTATINSHTTTINSHTTLINGKVSFSDLSTSGKTTINGGNITTGKIDAKYIDVTNLTVKSANIESLSFSKITGNSNNALSASNFSITGGSINMYPNPGYLVFGTTVSSHPYVSALNVAHGSGGIVICNGQSRTDVGEQIGYIDAGSGQYLRILTAEGKNMNITGRANMSIEISEKSSHESKGYLKIATNPYHDSGDGSIGSNPGSIYIYSHAHITLHAGHKNNEGHVYVGHGAGGNFRIATDSSGPSSLNLKTNLQKFDDKTYNEALQLLSELQLYNYTYKYNNLHPKKEQFGFIIDELLENELTNKFFYFRDEVAGITQSNNINYAALDEGNPYNEPIIHFKRYDEETLIKYLLVCNKALLQQLEGINQEIKEITPNEI